jgi:hypothetical protein
MNTVTISKKEYETLLEKQERYEHVRSLIEGELFASPPKRSMQAVMKEFKATKRYSAAFLRDLEAGMKRSNYFRA